VTDNANTPEPVGVEPEVVAKVAEELMASSDACGAQLLGEDGLLTQVTKAVLERALSVEMADHLGYEKGDPAGRGSGNSRNGKSGKRY
jgi:putative transposase